MSKFIGTIIDDNYWLPWKEGDKLYRICMCCDKPELVREDDKWMIGKKHYCEGNKAYWLDIALAHNQGFIFVPVKEDL